MSGAFQSHSRLPKTRGPVPDKPRNFGPLVGVIVIILILASIATLVFNGS